jgi:serine protease Do
MFQPGLTDAIEEGLPLPQHKGSRRFGVLVGLLLAGCLTLPTHVLAEERTLERQDEMEAALILRVKPAVVGILTDVSAEVTIRCGKNDTYVVQPDPERENGTGFIIHPDGWIATNGHVVEPVYKDDEEHIANFLQAAADAACGPALAKLPGGQRKARMQAILKDPENRKGVKLNKKLEVYLPTLLPPGAKERKSFPAVVKAYSPTIDPNLLPKGGGKPDPPMLDAAIIKIEATNLPTVRLALGIKHVHLGQQLFIVGFPGVVLWHDFLSRTSRTEATVTFGRVSSFKDDVNERLILQTDAPISWGNSGGPAFNRSDEVIGLATFISTSLEGDQAIQGFNFLIPVDTIQDLARQIGLIPQPESPFTHEWGQAGIAYFQGRYAEALSHLEAADKIVPGLMDVERVRSRTQELVKERPAGSARRQFLGIVVALVIAVATAGVFVGVRTARNRRRIPQNPA